MKCISRRINEYEMNDQLKNQIAFTPRGNYYLKNILLIPTLIALLELINYEKKKFTLFPVIKVKLKYNGTDHYTSEQNH